MFSGLIKIYSSVNMLNRLILHSDMCDRELSIAQDENFLRLTNLTEYSNIELTNTTVLTMNRQVLLKLLIRGLSVFETIDSLTSVGESGLCTPEIRAFPVVRTHSI